MLKPVSFCFHAKTLLLIGLLALLAGCTLPSDPGLPSWDVPVTMPFGTIDYSLDNMVTDQQALEDGGNGIIADSSGALHFYFSANVAELGMGPSSRRLGGFEPRRLALLPDQSDPDTASTPFASENRFTQGRIDTGRVYLHVENRRTVPDTVRVVLMNIQAGAVSDTFSIRLNLPAALSAGEPAVLDTNVRLRRVYLSSNEPGDILERLQYQLRPVGGSAGGDVLAEEEPDTAVVVDLSMGDMLLDIAYGYPGNVEQSTGQTGVAIEPFQNQQNLQQDLLDRLVPGEMAFSLELDESLDLPMILESAFTAFNENTGQEWNYNLQDTLDQGVREATFPGAEALFSGLPDRLVYETTVRSGYENLPLMLDAPAWKYTEYDRVRGRLETSAPLRLDLSDSLLLRPEPQRLDRSYDSPLQEMTLELTLENRFPTGGTLYLLAGAFPEGDPAAESQRARQELVPENSDAYAFLDPITVPGPELDGENRPLAPALLTRTLHVPPERMALLERESVYFREVMVLNPASGGEIQLYREEGITVHLIAELVYRVKEEAVEGDS